MTVRIFHGTDVAQEDPSQQSQVQSDSINMSFTYSDFLSLRATQPHEDEPPSRLNPSSTVTTPTTTTTTRHGGHSHMGSTSSLFSLGSGPPSYLPNEFQVLEESTVPLLQNAEEKNEDFIIIAEFSELEGPIPLCTIPYNAPETRTDINLNSLSVHLMSTDYQVNTVGHFHVCEDTQVMRTNVFLNVHVFMQYFTLYDIKARGFVRPFCFGYVSKDHVKLDRNVETLANEFNQISKVLKYANREWFANELSSYMSKLSSAKENFISRTSPPEEGEGEDGHFYFETGEQGADPISLSQIAFQYTEIETILKEVKGTKMDPKCTSELYIHESLINSNSDILKETLDKLNFIGDSFSTLNMPLVHPLKQKGESLRPITTLGQVGTLYLVKRLMSIYKRHHEDLIFTEMTNLTQDFLTHSTINRHGAGEVFQPVVRQFQGNMNLSTEIDNESLCKIIEKLHASVPIVASDDKSCSYHSLSDESDVQFPGGCDDRSIVENGGSPFASAVGSVDSSLNKEDISLTSTPSKSLVSSKVKHVSGSASASSSISKTKEKEQLSKKMSTSSTTSGFFISETNEKESLPQKASTSSVPSSSGPRLSIGYSSEEDSTPCVVSPLKVVETSQLEIVKISWWILAAKTKILKGDPGYGIWKFFRRFYKIGHHILYSILIGRPLIICANAKFQSRVRQLIFSLIPFVTCFPARSFKILPWHQGTLSPLNFRDPYKLIGLCIPERSNFHDLVHYTEQNTVTVLDFEAKKIMGPAYQGNYLKNFEELICQKKFFDDLSVLTYLGSILADIESQVFMHKTMSLDRENNVAKIMKQLNLKNSDAEIVKHLVTLILEPHEAVELF